MTPTNCPQCGNKADWYPVPEAGLLRCPICFNSIPATTTDTKKTSPKTKAK